MYRFVVCREMRARAPHTALSWCSSFNLSRYFHSLPFATLEVEEISGSQPAEVQNLVQGKWTGSSSSNTIVDPLNGEPFIQVAEVDELGIQPFVESLARCPKHGLHNPFKAPERYLLYGDISARAAHMLSVPKVSDFFTRLIQRVAPKSYQQAFGEVYVTQKFLENFSGDQVRFLARSFGVPGNHLGQQSHGFRWPYGPVAIVTPFNFPLEIPVLQLMGALYMGNKPVLKVDSKVSIVMDQMLRLLHNCGLPLEDVDFINSDGKTMNKLLLEANPRMTLFTGSSRVADKLAVDLKGRIKLEDAGFDWKILGPDVQEVDYVEDVEKIFLEIVYHIVELMTHPFGNYLVQKLLEACNEDQRTQIVYAITEKDGDLVRISCNMHGTRAVQKVIETIQTPQQFSMVVSSLKHGIVNMIKDINGSHVAKRCLQHLMPRYVKFLFEAVTAYCVEVATDRYGCCVLQKCLSYSDGEQRHRLICEITSNALILSEDPFGNYVLQYVFDLKLSWPTVEVLNQLEGNYGYLSMQKYSSNVVERCLIEAGEEYLPRIIQQFINNSQFDQIMQDLYGNYVIQTALNHSKGPLHAVLVEAIRPHISALRISPYGKKVLSCINLKK